MFAAYYDDFSCLPKVKTPTSPQLGSIACILLLVMSMMIGCSKISVAQEIVNWTPTVEQTVASLIAGASFLDPAAAPIFALAQDGIKELSDFLVAAAKSYLANPGTTTLQALQNAVAAMLSKVDAGLLTAARIVNPQSQKLALTLLNGIAAAVNAIIALVESISSKAAIRRMGLTQRVKLAQVSSLLDHEQMHKAAQRMTADLGVKYDVTPEQFIAHQEALGF
jgi:hypothetical protein